jgi:5-methylcytosine-specific restriction endonuclease McrA
MPTSLHSEYDSKTIQELVHLFNNDQLNLEPGFQRQSVWTERDRRKLIESIFQNYPIPSIFLYKQSHDGRLKYDVIDGKQRLESLLMFQGLGCFRGQRFSVRFPLDEAEGMADWDWNRVRRRGHEHRFMGYKIQTVEVSGEFSDIIDLFVRINSTGKRLTSAEKRHAKYYHSEFLKKAGRLAESRQWYFEENRILSKGQISRMKDVELVCELLASICAGGPINKKKALDALIAGRSVDQRSMKRCLREFIRTLNLVRRVFPNLKTTRFTKVSDFYSLFMLVWEMDRAGCILTDKQRNGQAQKLLNWLSDGVSIVSDQVKKAEGAKPDQRLFADYLLTVRTDTDSLPARKRRADILRQLLGGLFEKKDSQRGFTQEQRRLIWHSDEKRNCKHCGVALSWSNFTIDHVKPHSRGGKTVLTNAALMCRRCNSRKGNR